jgi:putative glutamine amidotransferase
MSMVVAVTAPRRTHDGHERVALNASYVTALAGAGLIPLIVPPTLAPAHASSVLEQVRGLVLTGGEDVDPARYHAAPHPKLEATDLVRDALEVALVGGARERRLPILGICRGIQILNVALGGTLYQDLPSERPGPIDHANEAGHHGLSIDPHSLLSQTLRTTERAVNSRHHQAIRDVAPPLRATAWADDGVIEGVEWATGGGWLLGVQWHPEDDIDRTLFAGLAAVLR